MKRKLHFIMMVMLVVAVRVCGQTAYVTNNGSHNLSVINVATNTVTHTITVGYAPIGVSVNPSGSRVYVTNENDNTVSIINTVTNTVSATILVGTNPKGLSVSPDGLRVYVANYDDHTVSIINTVTNTISATIPVGSQPYGIGVSPDGSKVYVVNEGSNSVSVINALADTITATIPVGPYPYGISVSSDGTKVYIANSVSNTVSVINTATDIVSTTITVGNFPIGVSSSPDGTKVYVTNNGASTVSVINATTNTVSATIPVGSSPYGISVSPDGSKVYVANYNANSVSVIATANNTVTTTIPLVGCSESYGFGNFISTYPNCFAHYTTSYDTILNNFTLNVDSATSALATGYHWDFGDGTTSTLATPSHTYTMDTVFDVCMKVYSVSGDSCTYCHIIGKDYLGNIYRTAGFTINVHNNTTVNVPTLTQETNIIISPNPFTSQTTITFSEEQNNTTIKVINVLGECIQQLTTNNKQLTLDMAGVAKGIYFVKIEDEKKNVVNRKIVVE